MDRAKNSLSNGTIFGIFRPLSEELQPEIGEFLRMEFVTEPYDKFGYGP